MAAQTVIDLDLSPSLTYFLEDDSLMEIKGLDSGSARELLSPSPSTPSAKEGPDSDREGNDSSNHGDYCNSRTTVINGDHIHRRNMNSIENVHQSDDTSFNNSGRGERNRHTRERQGHNFVMISHARANRKKPRYRQPSICQRDQLQGNGSGSGSRRDIADRAWRPAGSNIRNQWSDFGPEIPRSGPVGSIAGFPSLVEGQGAIPWMDPFGFEAINFYAMVQQATEENQFLKARVADLEHHLQRTQRASELYKDKFRSLFDEADRMLREWGREQSRSRQEHEWGD